jgi:hypothetical protein
VKRSDCTDPFLRGYLDAALFTTDENPPGGCDYVECGRADEMFPALPGLVHLFGNDARSVGFPNSTARQNEQALSHPNVSSRAQLAIVSGYSATSSSFANALGKIRTLELVGRGEPVIATKELLA